MSTVLTHQIIDDATQEVNAYITTVQGINGELRTLIESLTSSSFQGDASDGYKDFYVQKVVPAIEDNLIAPSESLTASIIEILDSIQNQLLDTVDPKLGENNRNPG